MTKKNILATLLLFVAIIASVVLHWGIRIIKEEMVILYESIDKIDESISISDEIIKSDSLVQLDTHNFEITTQTNILNFKLGWFYDSLDFIKYCNFVVVFSVILLFINFVRKSW